MQYENNVHKVEKSEFHPLCRRIFIEGTEELSAS